MREIVAEGGRGVTDLNTYIYALYHEPTKSFVLSAGYYGNETNIMAFKSQQEGEHHIESYYKHQGYKLRRLQVKK